MTTKNDKWSDNDIKRYSMLYSFLKDKIFDIKKDTFIEDNKKIIIPIIETNEKYKNSTIEALLFMIAKYLRLLGDLKYAKIYSSKAYDYLLMNREKENENEQDETEIINYRSHDYLLKVLKNIKPVDITTEKQHLQHLLLNLLVLAPPLRTSFYVSCKIITEKKDNDNLTNFILIEKNNIKYIVNQDKVSNTKTYLNKIHSVIPIENQQLIKLIKDSYKKYPRKYLFEIDDKPITHAIYLEWLRKITGVKGITNNIIRSSYINWFYSKDPTYNEKEKLSKYMRHSVLTSQKNYIKVIEPVNDIDYEILSNKLKNCESDNKLTDAAYKKRKRDIIYKINNKGVVPKEGTLNKYNIIYDEINKLYH